VLGLWRLSLTGVANGDQAKLAVSEFAGLEGLKVLNGSSTKRTRKKYYLIRLVQIRF